LRITVSRKNGVKRFSEKRSEKTKMRRRERTKPRRVGPDGQAPPSRARLFERPETGGDFVDRGENFGKDVWQIGCQMPFRCQMPSIC
jgi:hypothetical protein